MAEPSTSREPERRTAIIASVQTPLGFFVLVVLIVEAILGALVVTVVEPREFLVKSMVALIFFLVVIVTAIAVLKPDALLGRSDATTASTSPISLLVGPPKNLANLDITRIRWDPEHCFVVGERFQEKIALVPSRVGPTFKVHFKDALLSKVAASQIVGFELMDMRGNRWTVREFYVFENVVPLEMGEPLEKIVADYGEEP
jgi:hypothetical protein